jgi:4-hydroxy-tetrahydrodipicolinate synthase
MFSGSLVALVTPMSDDGLVDYQALERLLEFHLAAGTNGIVLCGSTGEGSVLSIAEKCAIIDKTNQVINQRIPVIVGVGSNSTQTTIEQAQQIVDCGVDALLVICPYYNRPTQEGLRLHFSALAENVTTPIIVYNHPGRTGVDILPETLAQLAVLPNIIGYKEAVTDATRFAELQHACGKELLLFSGDDPTCISFIQAGGHGVISVAANVVPEQMQMIASAALKGNYDLANDLQTQLIPLYDALSIESNPIPAKWMVAEMGLMPTGIRLPLTPLSVCYHVQIKTLLQKYDLLNKDKIHVKTA